MIKIFDNADQSGNGIFYNPLDYKERKILFSAILPRRTSIFYLNQLVNKT